MNIALYQGHFPVGKIEANLNTLLQQAEKAHARGVGLLFFPELALTGYPPEDLIFQDDFRARIDAALIRLKAALPEGIWIGVGVPLYHDEGVYNGFVILEKNRLILVYHKQNLPNYGVFDEARYFTPGQAPAILEWQGQRIGLLICEDIWHDAPLVQLREAEPDLVVVINASPFEEGKQALRQAVVQKAVSFLQAPILYVHQIGVQDEIIYDGASFYADTHGHGWAAPPFEAGIFVLSDPPAAVPSLSREAELYTALCFALKGYVEHHGFPGVLLGLSGGIDSALTLAIAVDALGRERVQAVLMPSEFSAAISLDDAKAEAEALGIPYEVIPIESLFKNFLTDVSPHFIKTTWDVTEENIQARLRGMILMALSNKSGKMVVTTTNKSELAVGYGTLYGDMAGGFALLKDVYKADVFKLARYRNTLSPVIPERVLTRPPSAELRPDQTDQDTLPNYPLLDAIIKAYVEENQSPEGIKKSLDFKQNQVVDDVIGLIQRSEYKRKQSPLGPKITARAFGKEWRMPVMK